MSLKINGWDVDWFLIKFKSNSSFSNIVETQMNMISIYYIALLYISNGIIFWIGDNYPVIVLKSFGWVLNCHLMINVLGYSCNVLTTNLGRWCELTIGQHWLGQYFLWQLHFYINGYFFLFYFFSQHIICGEFENNPAVFYVVLLNSILIYGLISLIGIDGNSYVLFMHGFCSS